MTARLTSEEKAKLRNSLRDKRLYNLLQAVCPTYERNLDSVRPCTEEVLQNAVEIFDALLGMSDEEASTYCRNIFNSTYCGWRDSSEVAGKSPKEEELNTTSALVLYTVTTLLALSNDPSLLNFANIIGYEADKVCHDAFDKIEKSFKPQLARALQAGLADWVKEYFDSEESVIPSAPVENQPCTSKIALRNGKTKDTGRGNKVKFMRVIMALYKANYFELPGGGDVGVETVFKAFGDMVGEDYSDYAEHLYSAGNHNINNPDKALQVFEELKRGFKKYLDEKPEE